MRSVAAAMVMVVMNWWSTGERGCSNEHEPAVMKTELEMRKKGMCW